MSVTAVNTPGSVIASGFDTNGRGQDADLHFVDFVFLAMNRGTSNLGLSNLCASVPGVRQGLSELEESQR